MADDTTPALGNTAIVLGGIAVGFLVVPIAANAAPEVVNGLLLLILLGALLMNSGVWLPFLAQFGRVAGGAPPSGGSGPVHRAI